MSEEKVKTPGPEPAADETPEGAPGAEEVRRVGLSARGYAAIAAAVVIVVAAAALGYGPTRGWVLDRLGLGPGEREAAMVERITVLEQRLARMSAELGALGQVISAAPSAARLDALARKVDALPAGIDAGRVDAIESRLGDLARRIESLSAAPREAAAPTAAPGDVALLGLALALDRGRPFARLLAAARKASGAGDAKLGPALATLAPWAGTGIPGRAALARDVAAIDAAPPPAAAKPAPATKPAPAAGIWDRIAAGLRGLVTVRRVGEAPAPRARPGDAVARALAAGDDEAAARALGAIDRAGLSTDGAAAYDRARDGLAARAAARTVVDAILDRLAAAAAP